MAVVHLDKANFDKEVKESKIPVIVDFWAPWCGPCKMMAPVFEELSSGYDGKLKFAKLNTDEESSLASQYDISGIPCLVVTKAGKEVDRIVGFAPKPVIKEKIETILKNIK